MLHVTVSLTFCLATHPARSGHDVSSELLSSAMLERLAPCLADHLSSRDHQARLQALRVISSFTQPQYAESKPVPGVRNDPVAADHAMGVFTGTCEAMQVRVHVCVCVCVHVCEVSACGGCAAPPAYHLNYRLCPFPFPHSCACKSSPPTTARRQSVTWRCCCRSCRT